MNEKSGIGSILTWLAVDNVLMAVLTIVAGLIFALAPSLTGNILVMFTGGMLVVLGLVAICGFLAYGSLLSGFSLAGGIFFLICGAFCLIQPSTVLGIITIILGIYIVIDAASSLADSVECIRAKVPGSWPVLVLSLVCLALGVAVVFGPASTIMAFIGWILVLDGVIDLVVACVFGKHIHKAKQQVKNMRAAQRQRDMIDLGEQ